MQSTRKSRLTDSVMESFPVEIIGHILSRIEDARDIVLASATCRKWREAFRNHLRALKFDFSLWSGYSQFTTRELVRFITQTIFQTNGLKSLSLYPGMNFDESSDTVAAWLMYASKTLCELHYHLEMDANFNILDILNCQKLEALDVAKNTIKVESWYRFPFWRSLSLSYVHMSALDISLLLSACPKLEVLKLVEPLFITSALDELRLELSSDSLKEFEATGIDANMFILKANVLEKLLFNTVTIDVLEFVGLRMLKVLKIEDVDIANLNIHESSVNLDVVDARLLGITSKKFLQMISRSSRLRVLRLFDVYFEDDNVIDLKAIFTCFPLLSHLCLRYVLANSLQYELPGSVVYENLLVLEIDWNRSQDLSLEWVSGLVERCPRLMKLVIFRSAYVHNNPESYM